MGSGRTKKNQVFQIAPAMVVDADPSTLKLVTCPSCNGDSTGCSSCHGTGHVSSTFADSYALEDRITSADFANAYFTDAATPPAAPDVDRGALMQQITDARREFEGKVADGTATLEDSTDFYALVDGNAAQVMESLRNAGLSQEEFETARRIVGREVDTSLKAIPEADMRSLAMRDGMESPALVSRSSLNLWANAAYRNADGSLSTVQSKVGIAADNRRAELMRGGSYYDKKTKQTVTFADYLESQYGIEPAGAPRPENAWNANDSDMWELRTRMQQTFGTDKASDAAGASVDRKMEALGMYKTMMAASMTSDMTDAQRARFNRERDAATQYMTEVMSYSSSRESLADLRTRVAADLGVSAADADRYMTPSSMLAYMDPYSGRSASADIAGYKAWDSQLRSTADALRPYTSGGVINLDSIDMKSSDGPAQAAAALEDLQRFRDYSGPSMTRFTPGRPLPSWMPKDAKDPGFSPGLGDLMSTASSDAVGHRNAIRAWADKQPVSALRSVVTAMDPSGTARRRTRADLVGYLSESAMGRAALGDVRRSAAPRSASKDRRSAAVKGRARQAYLNDVRAGKIAATGATKA